MKAQCTRMYPEARVLFQGGCAAVPGCAGRWTPIQACSRCRSSCCRECSLVCALGWSAARHRGCILLHPLWACPANLAGLRRGLAARIPAALLDRSIGSCREQGRLSAAVAGLTPASWCMGWHVLLLAVTWSHLLKLGCQPQQELKVVVCVMNKREHCSFVRVQLHV